MQALELRGRELHLLDDAAEPEPMTGEVIVDVRLAGLCETDLQLRGGYMGFAGILGHEFVGVATSGRFAGQRVVGEINCPCGDCELCRDGLGNHCPTRTVLGIVGRDGAFAERLRLPEANLLPVPDALPDEIAVFAEPVAAACQIPAQLDLTPFSRVAVLGDGRLGTLCAQVLSQHVRQVELIGKHREKLDRIAVFGFDVRLLDDTPEHRPYDLVVDATGSPTGIETAIRLVRPRGTIVLKTTVAGTQNLSLAPLVIDEISVVGSRCGPFDKALDALASGAVDVQPLISETVPLTDAISAFDRATNGETFKTLFRLK